MQEWESRRFVLELYHGLRVVPVCVCDKESKLVSQTLYACTYRM